MNGRSEDLQQFVHAAADAFGHFAAGEPSFRALDSVFSALAVAGPEREGAGSRLPLCSALEAAVQLDKPHPLVQPLLDQFMVIEPKLRWRRRDSYDHTASDNFTDGHANAMIFGPGGLEERTDLWLGATLMAPHVRYTDHSHAPEEVYLVVSPGQFQQGESAWFSPGVGGSFYNPPGIRHAMRSGEKPLLAFWALPVKA